MKFFIALFLILPSLAFANCEYNFKTAKLCTDIKWLTKPVTGKASSFELKFFSAEDKSKAAKAPSKEVNIYSWMKMSNGHDHGGPGLVVTRKENTWLVEKARFFGGMSGSWWIRVELKDADKVLEMVEIPVTVAEASEK